MATVSDNVTCTTKLLEAAEKGYTSRLKELTTQEEIDINGQNNEGMTALMLAAKNGHIDCVCWLIKDGRICINHQDENGKTGVMLAAEKGQVACVDYLLHIPLVKPGIRDNEGKTALSLAAGSGHDNCIQCLIGKVDLSVCDYCDIYGRTPLMYAALNGHLKCVELLVKLKCTPENNDQECAMTQDVALRERHCDAHDVCMSLVHCNPRVNLEDFDNEGNTAFMLAASKGYSDCLKFLIDKGQIDINRVNSERRTALMLASLNDHGSCVECLLQVTDIDINMKDKKGRTAIMLAAKNGNHLCVSLLLEGRGIDINLQDSKNKTCLMLSARYGRIECIKSIMKFGKVDFNVPNEMGQTALMLAAKEGYINCVKYLINTCSASEGKENINLQDETGNTALTQALHNHQKENILKDLISIEGINLNLQDKHGNTALMLAASMGKKDWVKDLINTHGVDVSIQNEDGWTALMQSILSDQLVCFKSLLDVKDQNLNIQDNDGCTALMLAAEYGRAQHVETLTDALDVDVNMQNNDGNTALAMASMRGHRDCVWILLHDHAGNIDINKKNGKGETALMLCAMNGHTGCMELLLKTKAVEINLQDHKGHTAIALASKNGHSECVKLLLRNEDLVRPTQVCNRMGHNCLLLASLNGHSHILRCFIDIQSKGQTYSDTLNSEHSQNGVTSAPIFIPKYPSTCFQYYPDTSWDCPYIYRCTQKRRTVLNIELGTSLFSCVSCFLLGRLDGSVPEIFDFSNNAICDEKLCIFDNEANTDLIWAAAKGFKECLEYLLQIHRVRFHTFVLLFRNEQNKNGTVSLTLYTKLRYFIRDSDMENHFTAMIFKGDHPGHCVDFLLSAFLCHRNATESSAISLAVFKQCFPCLRLLVEHLCNNHKLNQHMKYVFLRGAEILQELNFIPIFLKAGIFDWSWYPEFPGKKLRLLVRELVISGYSPGVFEWRGSPTSPLSHAFMIEDSGLLQYLVANLYMTSNDLKVLKGYRNHANLHPRLRSLSNQPWRLEALSHLAVTSLLRSKMRERDVSSISSNPMYKLNQDVEIRLSLMDPIRWLCVKRWREQLDTSFPLHGGIAYKNKKLECHNQKCCNGHCIVLKQNNSQSGAVPGQNL